MPVNANGDEELLVNLSNQPVNFLLWANTPSFESFLRPIALMINNGDDPPLAFAIRMFRAHPKASNLRTLTNMLIASASIGRAQARFDAITTLAAAPNGNNVIDTDDIDTQHDFFSIALMSSMHPLGVILDPGNISSFQLCHM